MSSDPAALRFVVFEHGEVRNPEKTKIPVFEQAMLGGIFLCKCHTYKSCRGVDGKFGRRDLSLLCWMIVFAGLRGADNEHDKIFRGCASFLPDLRRRVRKLAFDPLEIFEDACAPLGDEHRLDV